MKSFEKIRHKIGKRILTKKRKTLKRKICFYNLQEVKFVGILFDARTNESFKEAKDFIAKLASLGKEVYGLGLVEKHETVGNYSYSKDVDFFSMERLAWTGIPANPIVDKFISLKFNMLIDLTLFESLPMEYIFALSQAELKIACLKKVNDADLTIDISKNISVKYFLEQMTHYLSIMKSPQSSSL